MENGYALASAEGLGAIRDRLSSAEDSERDALRQGLRIGIRRNTQVTLEDASHKVSQAYCAALPVAYSPHAADLWADFAKLVLEASYEAALCAAALNSLETGNDRVFMTLLGGGAFGNPSAWIVAALEHTLQRYSEVGLDVAIVSYGSSNPRVREMIEAW